MSSLVSYAKDKIWIKERAGFGEGALRETKPHWILVFLWNYKPKSR